MRPRISIRVCVRPYVLCHALSLVLKQGHIHDTRCIPILHFAIFSDFYKSVTDGWTDGWTNRRTDQRTDTHSYRDARTHLKNQTIPVAEGNIMSEEKTAKFSNPNFDWFSRQPAFLTMCLPITNYQAARTRLSVLSSPHLVRT